MGRPGPPHPFFTWKGRLLSDPDRERTVNDRDPSGEASVVRSEEELALDAAERELGAARARKWVESERASERVPRSVEHFDEVERTGPNDQDSGEIETLPDGSVSIPILEEELVVEKRTIVRERVIVRKRTETRHEHVETTLRKERVAIDLDEAGRAGEP
jgi:uncharacterized protein (TIGR02271 family)